MGGIGVATQLTADADSATAAGAIDSAKPMNALDTLEMTDSCRHTDRILTVDTQTDYLL